jgi:hypothetical protein
MTNKSITGKQGISTSSQSEHQGASPKREWRRPKLETLAVRETLYGTSAGVDLAGFSPTRA